MSLYLPLFKALNDAGVKYVVVGGLATVLHGYARLTMDVDLFVDLAPDEAALAMRTLESLGFKPRVPVPAEQFADAAKRKEWIEQKGNDGVLLSQPSEPDALRRRLRSPPDSLCRPAGTGRTHGYRQRSGLYLFH